MGQKHYSQIAVRLDGAKRDKFRKYADNSQRSMNSFLVEWINAYIEKCENKDLIV